MAIFNKKLTKTVGEIRYRPTLSSTRSAVDFGKILEKKFPHWRVRNGQDVTLLDDDKKNLIQIRYNGLLFLNEGEETNHELIKLLETVYKEVIETTGVSEFLHVGCRRQYVFDASFQIQDLVDLTFRKFYGNLPSLKSISGERVKDTAFILDGIKEELNTHVQIGPSTVGQVNDFFKGQFTEVDLEESKAYLLVDIDVFKKEKLTAINSMDLLKKAEEINLNILNSYIEFLSAK